MVLNGCIKNIYLKLKNGIKGVTIFSVMTRLKIL